MIAEFASGSSFPFQRPETREGFLWKITANATADIATSHTSDSHSNQLFKGLGMEKHLES